MADIEMHWPKKKAQREAPRRLTVVRDRKPYGAIAAAVLVPAALIAAYCIGQASTNRIAADAMVEAEKAQGIAQTAKNSATRWKNEAQDASATAAELRVELADETERADTYRQHAEEASATIGRLKALIIQQKHTAPAPAGWHRARASWYGPGFYGHKMAGGGKLTRTSMVVAHRTLRFGTRVAIAYNGRTVIAEVRDRGPFIAGRAFDLGPGTAAALGFGGVQTIAWRVVES